MCKDYTQKLNLSGYNVDKQWGHDNNKNKGFSHKTIKITVF